MIYILTSTSTLLKTEVRPQVSNVDDSVAEGLLHLKLKQQLTSQAFNDQQSYLSVAAIAAYVSLNKLDQRQRYRASLNLLPVESESFNFTQGSSSSGLGYALSLFESWWKVALKHSGEFKYPLFVTGEILTSGQVKGISHLEDKIESACKYVKENEDTISNFYLCYPEENDAEITKEQREQVKRQGGVLLPVSRLQSLLGELLGDMYDGDPLGRWAPFKGLNSFNYEDSVRFFGRDKDIERLYDDLNQNDGLLIVTGASGTGKSSLIKAGLIPLLEQKNKAFYWSYTTPSMEVSKEGVIGFIFEQLDIAWGLRDRGGDVQELISTFRHSIDDGIEKLLSLMPERTRKCLLYLDQYEEVFNQSDQSIDDITFELTLIDELARQLKPLMIVLALRNEYLGRLLDNQALSSPIITNIPSQLSPDAWHDIIHEQAAFSGISFERDMADSTLDKIIISEAVHTPYALPMVEFLLEQLYLKAQDDEQRSNLLQFLHYEQLGGLSGAIAYRATQVLKDNDADSKLVAQLFERFVGLNGESLPYARSVNLVRLSSTEPVLYQLVQDFINANIIVSVVNNDNGHLVRLAHDSLFSNWTTLKKWLNSSKEYLLWRYSIDGQYNRWKTARFNEDDSKEYLLKDKGLLRDGRLFLRDEIIKDVSLERYIKESQKNKIKSRSSSFLLFVVLPLMLIALYQWDQHRIKSYYFSTVGEKWSVPFGVNELTDDQVAHVSHFYRLDYQGGILKKMSHQNSFGTLVADESKDNAAIWEYSYIKDGRLSSVIIKTHTYKFIRDEQYKFISASEAVVVFNKKRGGLQFLSGSTMPGEHSIGNASRNASNVSRYLLIYNHDGYLEKRFYQDPYGKKVTYIGNSYGTEYQYERRGLPVIEYELKENGEHLTIYGIEKKMSKYDSHGHVIESIYLRKHGEDSKTTYNYDSWGNNTEITFSDGTKIINIYDIAGNHTETLFYRLNLPSLNEDGNARLTAEYDGFGRVIKEVYFGLNGKRIAQKGFSEINTKYDNQGRVVEEAYFGLSGESVIREGYFAKTTVKYDHRGNIIEQAYFGLMGEAILRRGGYAKVVSKYDDRGNVIEDAYYGLDDLLIITDEGAAKVTMTHDAYGHNLEEAYFGTDGTPVLLEAGYAKMVGKSDSTGHLIALSYYGIAGQPVLVDGYARMISKVDINGNMTDEFEYYGLEGEVVKPNYRKRQDVEFDFSDEKQLKSNDEQPVTKFIIDSEVTGNKVLINGNYKGITDLALTVTPGEYFIEVIKRGYKTYTQTVVIKSNENIVIDAQMILVPELGLDKLQAAASNGNAEAQKNLGNRYLFGKGIEKSEADAMFWYQKSAMQGYANAQYNLGYMYQRGLGVKQNNEKAFEWYKLSAEKGFPLGQKQVGWMYFDGQGVQQDREIGIEWLIKASGQGDSSAQYMLGVIFHEGVYIERDDGKAFKLITDSAKQGISAACHMLGYMYDEGIGVKANNVQSFYWYLRSAKLGNSRSFYKVGYAYTFEKGIDKNINEAIKWFLKASKSNSGHAAGAEFQLGGIYRAGDDVIVDYEKAFYWYEKSASRGTVEAANELGTLYLKGYGIDKNYDIGIFWLKKAASEGNEFAKKKLNNLGEQW